VLLIIFGFGVVIPPGGVYAQILPGMTPALPAPGTMLSVTPGYAPALIRGIGLHPENPLQFDFIIDTGDSGLTGARLEDETIRMVKYFLAALTVPEQDLWVNLSPNEPDRIIPDAFAATDMGTELLAQDYILKQLTASLIYPEEELGAQFWARVRREMKERFGVSDIPMEQFSRVWIVPQRAEVFEQGNLAVVVDSYLKVMLADDYENQQRSLAEGGLEADDSTAQKNLGDSAGTQNFGDSAGTQNLGDSVGTQNFASLQKTNNESAGQGVTELKSQIIREVIIPALEHEVNQGSHFAKLRQINQAVILAKWYKQTLRESLLARVYADQNKIKGIDTASPQAKQEIYDQYLEALRRGVYDYIREEEDPLEGRVIPRRYFSGGTHLAQKVRVTSGAAPDHQRTAGKEKAAEIFHKEGAGSSFFLSTIALGENPSSGIENTIEQDRRRAHLRQADPDGKIIDGAMLGAEEALTEAENMIRELSHRYRDQTGSVFWGHGLALALLNGKGIDGWGAEFKKYLDEGLGFRREMIEAADNSVQEERLLWVNELIRIFLAEITSDREAAQAAAVAAVLWNGDKQAMELIADFFGIFEEEVPADQKSLPGRRAAFILTSGMLGFDTEKALELLETFSDVRDGDLFFASMISSAMFQGDAKQVEVLDLPHGVDKKPLDVQSAVIIARALSESTENGISEDDLLYLMNRVKSGLELLMAVILMRPQAMQSVISQNLSFGPPAQADSRDAELEMAETVLSVTAEHVKGLAEQPAVDSGIFIQLGEALIRLKKLDDSVPFFGDADRSLKMIITGYLEEIEASLQKIITRIEISKEAEPPDSLIGAQTGDNINRLASGIQTVLNGIRGKLEADPGIIQTSDSDSAMLGLRVLVVDDYEGIRKMTARLLEDEGHEVVAAASGDEGLSILGSGAEPFDLVVSDFQMPGMDGGEFSSQIQDRWPHLPVIIQTGSDFEQLPALPGNVKMVLPKGAHMVYLPERIQEIFGKGDGAMLGVADALEESRKIMRSVIDLDLGAGLSGLWGKGLAAAILGGDAIQADWIVDHFMSMGYEKSIAQAAAVASAVWGGRTAVRMVKMNILDFLLNEKDVPLEKMPVLIMAAGFLGTGARGALELSEHIDFDNDDQFFGDMLAAAVLDGNIDKAKAIQVPRHHHDRMMRESSKAAKAILNNERQVADLMNQAKNGLEMVMSAVLMRPELVKRMPDKPFWELRKDAGLETGTATPAEMFTGTLQDCAKNFQRMSGLEINEEFLEEFWTLTEVFTSFINYNILAHSSFLDEQSREAIHPFLIEVEKSLMVFSERVSKNPPADEGDRELIESLLADLTALVQDTLLKIENNDTGGGSFDAAMLTLQEAFGDGAYDPAKCDDQMVRDLMQSLKIMSEISQDRNIQPLDQKVVLGMLDFFHHAFIRGKDGQWHNQETSVTLFRYTTIMTRFSELLSFGVIRQEDIRSYPNLWEMTGTVVNLQKTPDVLSDRGLFFDPMENFLDQIASVQAADPAEIDEAMLGHTKGGIDLSPALFDLQIRRDENGVPLPLLMQPLETMNIEGFYPILINIQPAVNLPLIFGLREKEEAAPVSSSADRSARAFGLDYLFREEDLDS